MPTRPPARPPLQGGYTPELAYSLAACQYRGGDLAGAAASLAQVVQAGVQQHPELGIGTQTEGMEVGGRLGRLGCSAGRWACSLRAARGEAAWMPATHQHLPTICALLSPTAAAICTPLPAGAQRGQQRAAQGHRPGGGVQPAGGAGAGGGQPPGCAARGAGPLLRCWASCVCWAEQRLHSGTGPGAITPAA